MRTSRRTLGRPPPQARRDCSYFGEQRLVDATLVLVHSRSPGSRGPHAVQRSVLGVGHVSPDDGDGGPVWTALDAHVVAELFDHEKSSTPFRPVLLQTRTPLSVVADGDDKFASAPRSLDGHLHGRI